MTEKQIQLSYCVEVIKDNQVIEKLEFPSKSFVENFALTIRGLVYSTGQPYTWREEDGNYRNTMITYVNQFFSYLAVGSGTTPPKPTDYRFEALIDRKRTDPTAYVVEADKCKFEQVAEFSWTEEKTISEIGIFFLDDINKFVLVVRDVLPTAITVPAGATFRLKYLWVFPV